MSSESTKTLIIDLGSRFIKAGFSDKEEVTTKIDSYIGKNYLKKYTEKDEIEELLGELNPNSPKLYFEKILERGLIKNEEDYIKIIKKVLELENITNCENIHLIYPIPLNTPISEKKKISEIFLTKLNFLSINFPDQPICSLKAYNIETGCLLEIGDSITQLTCIINSQNINCNTRSEFGTNDIKNYLNTLIRNNGIYLYPKLENFLIEDILENHTKNLDHKKGR